MPKAPRIVIDTRGVVCDVNGDAIEMIGVSRETLVDQPLCDRLIEAHRVRFSSEIQALATREERRGRVHATVIGLDGIGRRVTMKMSLSDDDHVQVLLSPFERAVSTLKAPGSALLDQGRLLPVARRISAASRRATSREALLSTGLEILAEVTGANAGAALEWSVQQDEKPLITYGVFNPYYLHGIFRPGILARLTRGDVVVKAASLDGREEDVSLLIVPLLSSAAPVAILVLSGTSYSVLVPQEQERLSILGEILGLGLKALGTGSSRSASSTPHRGDSAASVALGRLSAGLAHEINNAVTVLQGNLEQLSLSGEVYGHGDSAGTGIKDSFAALDVVHDLSEALRAFGPEETPLLEKVDMLRVLDMVVRSVRFYAKRGMNISLDRPEEALPLVLVHSHHLIRSLFLILVELVESSFDSGIELGVNMTLSSKDSEVNLTLAVTAGPFSLPTILLSQLEHEGALSRHVSRAGGELSHAVDHDGNLVMSLTLPAAEDTADAENATPAALPSRRGKILIAENEPAVLRSLRRLLERDHDVIAARTGEETLEIIGGHPDMDIILYDASMPRMAGPLFFEELTRLHLPVTERVIFVSGGIADTDISQFLVETENDVIEKPFDLPALNEILARMLK